MLLRNDIFYKNQVKVLFLWQHTDTADLAIINLDTAEDVETYYDNPTSYVINNDHKWLYVERYAHQDTAIQYDDYDANIHFYIKNRTNEINTESEAIETVIMCNYSDSGMSYSELHDLFEEHGCYGA